MGYSSGREGWIEELPRGNWGFWIKKLGIETFFSIDPFEGLVDHMASENPPSFDASDTLRIRKGDYVSPGLRIIVPDECFPRMKEGDISTIPNPLFRKHIAHTWYIDPDFPYCGFLSRDEAHILYNLALQFKGQKCLEIGAHVGWSTVHLALAGVQLDVIEPQLGQDPRILLSVIDALRRAGVQKNVNLVPGYSPSAVLALVSKSTLVNGLHDASLKPIQWSMIFVDGNHDGDGPLEDAKVAHLHAAQDAIIVFHDLAFPDVAKGWRFFIGLENWQTCIYNTQQIIGIAWRGTARPLHHIPDPTQDWSLPTHLSDVLHLVYSHKTASNMDS